MKIKLKRHPNFYKQKKKIKEFYVEVIIINKAKNKQSNRQIKIVNRIKNNK